MNVLDFVKENSLDINNITVINNKSQLISEENYSNVKVLKYFSFENSQDVIVVKV